MRSNRWSAFVLTLLYGILVIIGIGYITHQQALQATNSVQKVEILAIEEFQALLNQAEPANPIPEDGKLGPLTQAKWERVWANQVAKQFYEGQNND